MASVRLESLALTGFKSFPDGVEIVFPGQVSAIVGPNGCGKSNLVDAILWVLGEQSPTLLRLKNMGDLVFSGAAGRPAAGAAEVVLRLRSDAGHWPDTDGRLEIRRRVFKSGPSEYRLNGRTARLRDVVDELHSVGLGTRGYAIIEQGRVGQVLSARPTDRRVLIEEAAGVTRYKARRHEAELKLERTRQNLLRLDDVVTEVHRSLRQLKRQARQAEQYQALRGELRERTTTLLTLQAHRLDRERRDAARRRAEAQNEVAAAASALGSAEADLSASRRRLDEERREVDAARAEVSALATSQERLAAFLERSADLLDNLRGSLERATRESSRLEGERTELVERLAAAVERHAALEAELRSVREREKEASARAGAAGDALRSAEEATTAHRQDLLKTISTLTESRNRLGDLEREQDRLTYVVGQLDHEQERIAVRRREAEDHAAETVAASRAAAAAVERVERERRALVDERGRLQDEASAARQTAESAGHDAWELRHRIAGVERELARHTAAAEQLAAHLPEGALAGQVSDRLRPDAKVATVLDRLWSEWLELPLVRSVSLDDDARDRLEALEQRIRLVVVGDPPPAAYPAAPGGAVDLLADAGVADADRGWIERTIPPTWRCSDPRLAARLAEAHPGAIILDGDGVVRRGRVVEPPTVGSGRPGALALRDERTRLEESLAAATASADAARARQQELASRLATLADGIQALDRRMVAAEQERARNAALEQAATAEHCRLQRELEALRADVERHRALGVELGSRRQRIEREVETLESRGHGLERALEESTGILDARREAAADARGELERVVGERRLAEERTGGAAADASRLAAERDHLDARRDALGREAHGLAEELGRTEDEVVRSRARLAEEQGMLSAARDRERRLAGQVERAQRTTERLEREVRERRDVHERTRDALHQVEVEVTRIAAEWDRLRDATAEIERPPEQLLEDVPDESRTVEQLRSDVERLRAKLESTGPVNLLAVREAAELEERSRFLSEQRADLVASLDSLDATIREIDDTCTERFLATFEKVNEVLGETFTFLFGGGSARLALVDEDDPLTSGVDITAQPPGKRNQSVQLLSGGEKALTALSLLISLFRIKPSPFCVLDEVDAPLDDANVERLADLVQAMTDHTQFVVITHNRRTMARAEALYGVTMEEPGVSKLVTVRLER